MRCDWLYFWQRRLIRVLAHYLKSLSSTQQYLFAILAARQLGDTSAALKTLGY